jgi:hypothetical protein
MKAIAKQQGLGLRDAYYVADVAFVLKKLTRRLTIGASRSSLPEFPEQHTGGNCE